MDLRRGSPTFGEWEAYELNDENLHQLYCPIGFAHGFCVTSETADVMYKCSGYYDESIERGISYNDPEVGIEWPDIELLPSERDASAPSLSDVAGDLPFVYDGAAVTVLSRVVPPGRRATGGGPAGPPSGPAHWQDAVQGTVGAARRTHRLDRLDRDVDTRDLHDRQGELVPGAVAGVRDVEEATDLALHRGDQGLGQIGGVRRGQALVGHHSQRVLLARSRDHALHEVPALGGAAAPAVEPGGPNDQRAVAVRERSVFAGQLGDRVDAPRAGQVSLVVRLASIAGEDVVRAHVDEQSAPRLGAAPAPIPLHGLHVDREGAGHLALADLDVVERRAVEYDRGADRLERRGHLAPVGDVEFGVARGGDVASLPQQGDEVRGELASAARDEHAAAVEPILPSYAALLGAGDPNREAARRTVRDGFAAEQGADHAPVGLAALPAQFARARVEASAASGGAGSSWK